MSRSVRGMPAIACALAVTGCYSPMAIRAHDQSANQSCEADKKAGRLATYMAMAQCVNAADSMYERRGMYQDIATGYAVMREAIAKDADAGKLNEAQVASEFARISQAMNAAIAGRNADRWAEVGEKFQSAGQHFRDAGKILLGGNDRTEDATSAPAVDNAALLRFSAGLLAPTRSGTFGESVNNGLSGTPPPPSYAPAPYPTQTICFRSGPNVICNTQ